MIILAAIILMLVAVIHSVLGEVKLLGPIFAQSPDGILQHAAVRKILRGAWHIMSLGLIALGIALLQANGSNLQRPVAVNILVFCLASAAVCLWAAGPKHPGTIGFAMCAGALATGLIA